MLKVLFPEAKYTILADINQTIEKQMKLNFNEEIQRILDIKAVTLLTMSKGLRSTDDIIDFSSKFIDDSVKLESFSRSGISP